MTDHELLLVISKQLSSMDNRLDTMDSRFDAIDNRLDAMDSRFDVMDNRFDKVEDTLNILKFKQTHMSEKLDGLDLTVKYDTSGKITVSYQAT